MSCIEGGEGPRSRWAILYRDREKEETAPPRIYPVLSLEDPLPQEEFSDGELIEAPTTPPPPSTPKGVIRFWNYFQPKEADHPQPQPSPQIEYQSALAPFIEAIEASSLPPENPYSSLCEKTLNESEQLPLAQRIGTSLQIVEELASLGERVTSCLRLTFYAKLVEQEAKKDHIDLGKGADPRSYLEQFCRVEEQLIAQAGKALYALHPPQALIVRRPPQQMASCISYIDAIFKGSEGSSVSWFKGLPPGVQYRLYHNLCDKKIGASENRLLELHNQNPLSIYHAIFPRDETIDGKKLTPEFIRSNLFTRYVQKRLASYPKRDQEILKSIEYFTMIYHISNKPDVWISHMRKIKPEVSKFLSEDFSFLSYFHQQALLAGAEAPVCDSRAEEAISWAIEHFLEEDPHLFYQAITRWYDVLPVYSVLRS